MKKILISLLTLSSILYSDDIMSIEKSLDEWNQSKDELQEPLKFSGIEGFDYDFQETPKFEVLESELRNKIIKGMKDKHYVPSEPKDSKLPVIIIPTSEVEKESWKPFTFNGEEYYIIPLASNTKMPTNR